MDETPSSPAWKIDLFAGQAMIYAAYPFTWGIVYSSSFGEQGKELGSGIGIQWHGHFMIVTAGHVLSNTPEDQLFFFPPAENMKIAASVDDFPMQFRKRQFIERPKKNLLYGQELDLDLGVIPLLQQFSPVAETNFWRLTDCAESPQIGKAVALVGYPGDMKISVGANFAAGSYSGFGVVVANEAASATELAISYKAEAHVSPKGMSGSGAWHSGSAAVAGALWCPEVRLGGILTHHSVETEMLTACRVEALIAFLKENELHFQDG